jgi:PhnB protein
MTLGATLYVKDSRAAVEFYLEAFGMTLGYHAFNPDGTYLHAELGKDGRGGFAVSESPDGEAAKAMLCAGWPTMSYGIDFENDAALEKAYAALLDGGHVLKPLGPLPWTPLSADIVDKFGVYWYIYVSQHRPD